MILVVLTAELELVDRRRQSCDEEPAAGATMTSSHGPDKEAGKGEDAKKDSTESHTDETATRTATATGICPSLHTRRLNFSG